MLNVEPRRKHKKYTSITYSNKMGATWAGENTLVNLLFHKKVVNILIVVDDLSYSRDGSQLCKNRFQLALNITDGEIGIL